MRSKNIYTYILFSAILFLSLSCTKKFEEINTDPNRPKTVYPGPMLGQLQYKFIASAMEAAKEVNHELVQVTAPRASVNGGIHRYQITNGTGSNLWNEFYSNMADLQDIISMSEKMNEPNYKAIALVYKSWSYSILTDAFKDVPYSEVARIDQIIYKPKFDKQSDIYKQILQDLIIANDLFTNSQGLSYGGDLVYRTGTTANAPGILKWKKFCNSLRLRLLLRILKRDGEVNVSEQISAILSDPVEYPIFSSNADDAIFQFTGSFPYFNPYYNARTLDWRSGDYYTEFFLQTLNATEDPRRTVWSTQVEVDGKKVYQGIKSGYESTTEYVVDRNSSYSDALRTLPTLGIMMTYAEVEFIKAELALRGFATGGNSQGHYEKGIAASMVQWKVTMPTGFLEKQGIAYVSDASFEDQLEQIMLQKYYVLYFTDYQSWFEKRRTGYPELTRGSGIPATNQFPSRLLYPTYLQSVNRENLDLATQSIGGDLSTVKAWWE